MFQTPNGNSKSGWAVATLLPHASLYLVYVLMGSIVVAGYVSLFYWWQVFKEMLHGGGLPCRRMMFQGV